MKRRWRKILLISFGAILSLVVLVFLAGTLALRGSLARLDGKAKLAGLDDPVTITRDDLGVPDIQAASRLDAARALGYLHGQDRFFQMDMLRRNAAGELADLMGPALLGTDRKHRVHKFRSKAQAVVNMASGEDQALLEAYAAGVNSGLDDLRTRPFEYLFLRTKPVAWLPEDTILTLYSMFLDLIFSTVDDERNWAVVRDQLPEALAEFLLPRSSPWEAPLQTEAVPGIVIPDSSDVDVRRWTYSGMSYDRFRAHEDSVSRHDAAGSNNWAVAGHLSGHGGALVASDMHLGISLPNTWYRVRMSWPEGDHRRSVVGATLPGTPTLVAGSNGQVAWGFTTSYGDWTDLIILETDPADTTRYLTPDGWLEIARSMEIIQVKGADPDTLWLEETIWGPVWGHDSLGRRLALRYAANDPETANLNLRRMETVTSVEEVVAMAGTFGIPQMNLVCGDSQGNIAWTLAGYIPRRVGWDGRLPVSWADGSCRWDGYLDPAEQPRIVNPSEGRLWTANNRVAAGEDLKLIGDGGYAPGLRARQIRDDLRSLVRPTEMDMLKVQLDDRAIYLENWRGLALDLLDRHGTDLTGPQQQFGEIIRNHWSGRAEPGSVSYRLMKYFSWRCTGPLYELLAAKAEIADPAFRARSLPHRQAVAWQVIAARSPHLLPPWFDDWDDYVMEAINLVMYTAEYSGLPLEEYTWGAYNVVSVAHPFTQVAPWLDRWLASEPRALPGDSQMPRVQSRHSGASQRMVVSPGREEDGIFHMPGGQSGHPLSPYFLAGHEDWELGRATPLLPGPEKHRLELVPVVR